MTVEILVAFAVGWAISKLSHLEVRPGRRERARIRAEIEALDAELEKRRELEHVENLRAHIRRLTT